jgi:hypothetical protein
MWDGKSLTSIAKSYLGEERKLSSNTCHVCLAVPSSMNTAEVWDRPVMTQMLDYGCTPLHLWIRCMEYLFNIACRLPSNNKISATSKEFLDNKKALQVRIYGTSLKKFIKIFS